MFILRGLKCTSVVAFTFLYIIVSMQINSKYVLVNARNLDHFQDDTCENVKNFFSILNITTIADSKNSGKKIIKFIRLL